MKSKRKWLAGILSVVMTMTFMPAMVFAGENGGNNGTENSDAPWTLKDYNHKVVGNYDTLQEAIDEAYPIWSAEENSDGCPVPLEISLNKDFSGKGCVNKNTEVRIDLKGHTYDITESVSTEDAENDEDSENVALYTGTEGQGYISFKNGTVKISTDTEKGIKNCGMIDFGDCTVDASANAKCKYVVWNKAESNGYDEDIIGIGGASNIKASGGNHAIYVKASPFTGGTINTTGTIDGTIEISDLISDDGYFGLTITNGNYRGDLIPGGGKIKLKGGTLDRQPLDVCVADGYELEKNEDGTWSVNESLEYKGMKEKIQALQEKIEETKNGADKKAASYTRELYRSQSIISELINKNIENPDAAEKSLTETKGKIQYIEEELQNTINEYTNKAEGLEAEVQAIHDELENKGLEEAFYLEFENLNSTENEILTNLYSVRESLEEVYPKIEKAELIVKNAKTEAELKKAQEELKKAQDEIDDLKKQLAQKDTELKDKDEKLTESENSNKTLKEQLEQAKKEKSNLENQLTTAQNAQTELQKKLDASQKAEKKLQDALDVKTKDCEKLEADLKASSGDNATLNEKLTQAEKERDQLKTKLSDKEKECAKANKELEELNKKIDTLQNSLKETQDKLKKAEEELKNQNNKPTPSPTAAPVKKPGQVKGLKLKAGKKKVTVTYKKVSGATSYKVTYSTSKKFKKAKTVTVKSGKTVKKIISKLKSKKTYYVKVCAVKKVKGKSYTGKWSAVKKVKVK